MRHHSPPCLLVLSALCLLLTSGLRCGLAQAPDGGPDRAAWITEQVQLVATQGGNERDQVIRLLAAMDEDGDCVEALTTLLDKRKKDRSLVVAVVRGLGRDGLVSAATVLTAHLKDRRPEVRGHAAVSLEYVGASDAKVLAGLKRLAKSERDAGIANHAYRALGRCGVEDRKVGSFLAAAASSARSEFASYGPLIALAYREKDARAARAVEKILKKIGIPSGGWRASARGTVQRALACWTLAHIADPKTPTFVRERLIAPLDRMEAWWVDALRGMFENVNRACAGEEAARQSLFDAVNASSAFLGAGGRGAGGGGGRRRGSGEANDQPAQALMDIYRRGRLGGEFRPRGDGLLPSRDG